MCIFSQPVESVTNTKIFARLQDGDWQHLVYQMSFASQRDNAIILPFARLRLSETDLETLRLRMRGRRGLA